LHFRRCLADAAGGRRVRALYDLGCALLQESQGRQAGPLRAAVASFEQALDAVPPADPFADDLRHNLELAKRLLAAVRPARPNQQDELPDEPPSEPPAPPPGSAGDETGPGAVGLDPAGTQFGPDGRPRPRDKADGGPSRATDRPQPPGKGHLPPLPDEDALAPLTPEDAQAQLKRTAPAAATRFPEW